MQYPFLEILFFSTLFVGGLIGVILLISKSPSGRWLGFLICAYLLSIILQLGENELSIAVSLTVVSVSFYLYVRAFFFQKNRTSLIHLVGVAVPLMLDFLLAEFEWVVWATSFSVMGIYTVMMFRLLLSESETRGFSYFQNPGSRISWMRGFVMLHMLMLILLTIQASTVVLSAGYVIIYSWILYQLFKESSFLSPIPLGNKYKKSTLTPEIKSSIIDKLEEVMDELYFYRRDDASLTSLAKELGATTHHLSQVLNESLKISFQDLIARFRIREACKLLCDEKQEQVKIENIATMVGYNSKSAFNTAFKKRTGLTPSEYREARDVRTYGEERLSERKAPLVGGSTFHLNHVFNLKIKSGMIQHFFKSFSRNIKRNALFSFLNVLGLTVGFTCSILIYLYVQDELSYDRALPDSDRIYRIAWMGDNPQTRTPHPMAQAMVNDFPEVEEAVSFSPWYGPALSKDFIRVENEKRNIIFEEPDFFFADSAFFEVFELELVEGDKDALKKPFAFVITESLAKKYFGDSSAIGQELRVNQMPIAVSAVVKPMPTNSHFHFNAIIPYVTLKQINPNDARMKWGDFGHLS